MGNGKSFTRRFHRWPAAEGGQAQKRKRCLTFVRRRPSEMFWSRSAVTVLCRAGLGGWRERVRACGLSRCLLKFEEISKARRFACVYPVNDKPVGPRNRLILARCSGLGRCLPCSHATSVLLSTPRIFRHSTAVIFRSNRRFLICSPICWGCTGYALDFHK
jgi:hypothetical protein